MTRATAAQQTVDLRRERPGFFRASRKPELVDVPEAVFLVVDGTGAPADPAFRDAIGALYSVAYTLKISEKKNGRDFKVPTFEGAWWIGEAGHELPPAEWRWQLHMMVPDFVGQESLHAAKELLAARKKAPKANVRLERIRQGLCVQIMHVGPYATEQESIDKMLTFMQAQGLRASGPHHEVYLGDPNRAKPEALKTILKLPVERIASNEAKT